MTTEAVEVCPWCGSENVFANWDIEKQGYVAECWQCGKHMFLCDECMHADDNPAGKCDWHERRKGKQNIIGECFRGMTRNTEMGGRHE